MHVLTFSPFNLPYIAEHVGFDRTPGCFRPCSDTDFLLSAINYN